MLYLNKKSTAKTVKMALRTSVSYAAMTCMLVQPVLAAGALPSGGQVVAGDVSITAPSANEVLVSQTSGKGVVNWTDFSVGQGNSVQFNNGSGATLNRVTGATVSSIDGRLSATGSVYLINANGVIVGSTGVINTGGSFVASTLDTLDADFLDGGDTTFKGGSKAAIVNYGKVGSLGGDVALIAAKVDNEGTIEAQNGTAALAAGYEVLMRDAALADGKFVVKVGGSDTEARNGGALKAADAELRANDGNVYALSGNLGGFVRADGVSTSDGHVFLTAEGGTVTVDSTVSAKNADGSGGLIVATGENVALKDGAKLVADGIKGGTVLVGGDQYGSNDASRKLVGFDVANAGTVTVDAGATVSANGSDAEGGKIVIWSDDFTDYKGSLSTLGAGTLGGFAEVSSKGVLNFDGAAETGMDGELLLDPYNLKIVAGSGGSNTATSNDSTLGADKLKTLLDGNGGFLSFGNNVTVSTGSGGSQAGDITVSSAVNWTTNHNLTLQAAGSIAINATVTGSNSSAALNLQAKNAITQTAAITVDTLNVSNNGGAVNAVLTNAGNSVNTLTAGTSSNRVGSLSFTNKKSLDVGAAGLFGFGASGLYSNGAVNLTTTGATSDITVAGVLDTTGSAVNLSAGRNVAVNNDLTASTADITLTAGTSGGNSTITDGTSGAITANKLALLGGTKVDATVDRQVLFAGAATSVNILAANVGNLTFFNGKALTIGTVGATNGITATGDVALNLTENGNALAINQAVTASGDVSIATNGAVTQSATGIITADALSFANEGILGTAASVALTADNLVNSISAGGTLAALGNFSFTNAKSLTVDKAGISSSGTVTVYAKGAGSNLTLASAGANSSTDGITTSLTGNVTGITVAADGNFINNAGSNALQTGNFITHNARWLVFAGSSVGNTFGGLNSSNQAVWGMAYPNTVSATGNRYVFANDTASTTLDVTLVGATKVYGSGVDLTSFVTGAALNYTGHAAVANAYKGDAATTTDVKAGDLGFTSNGTPATANVGGYDVVAAYGGYDTTITNGLTVTKKALTVTANDAAKTYNGLAYNGGNGVTYDGFVNNEGSSVLGGSLVYGGTAQGAKNAGTYSITASGQTSNNYTIAFTGGSLVVGKAVLTATANNQTKTYGDNNPNLTVTYTGFVNRETKSVIDTGATLSTDATKSSDAGNYDITAANASDNNYSFVYVDGTLKVNKATLLVTADSGSKTYGDDVPSLGASYAGFKLGQNSSVIDTLATTTTNAVNTSNAGLYSTKASGAADNNYNFVYIPGLFTVNKAVLTVTADDLTKIYGDANPTLTATYSGFKFKDGVSDLDIAPTLTTSAKTNSNVGNYAITANSLFGIIGLDNNYTFKFNAGTMAVTPAMLTIAANEQTKIYGQKDPALSYSVSGYKLKDGSSVLSGALDRDDGQNVGNYDIGQGSLAANSNYTISYTGNTLHITPATLTVVADGQTKVYGDLDPSLTYSASGFQYADDNSVFTGGLDRADGRNVGSYGIGVGSLAAGGNYTIAYTGNTLSITPRSITVTADNLAKLLGNVDPALTWKITDGNLVYDDSITGSLTRDGGQLPGDYAITQGDVAASSNYQLTFVNGTLTINPLTQPGAPDTTPGSNTETPAGQTPQGGQAGNGPDGGETTGSIVDTCDGDNTCINKPYPTNQNPVDGVQFVSN
ncbi:MAG: beta strand repeat-containing protein [Parvibaculaceae bacterium]